VIQLYAAQAPLAVNSFVFLARQHWFDGVTFHRVIPGFVAQAGDPSGTGRGGPGYVFDNEIRPDLLFDKPGVVGMANSGPDTNGSQFFITYSPQPQLDGGYTVFGQVTAGMDILGSLTPRDPQSGGDLPAGDKILGITIEEH
jgi:cyclophilin family peptidyl-prolyl cis-trans isomerase